MKQKNLCGLIVGEVCLLLVLVGIAVWLHFRETSVSLSDAAETTAGTTATSASTEHAIPSTDTAPPKTTQDTTVLISEPVPQVYHLTFAGDCTLGTLYDYYSAAGSFPSVVGENYAYPFSNVQDWFAADDFTMVNLEGPLSYDGTPADKTYVMRGDPAFAAILPAGSVECVSIANNHTMDLGLSGYETTRQALDSVGIAYAGDAETVLITSPRGLRIGVLCVAFYIDPGEMQRQISSLKSQGAQLVIVSYHWGDEGNYHYSYDQQSKAYAAIDAGANIVFGHHPHVLQAMESYNGGMIYYSLGNFSFGGNDDPADYDTALISQEVIVDIDGTVSLGNCTPVPCRLSSTTARNDFCPTPLSPDDAAYTRVLEKLNGTFTGTYPGYGNWDDTTVSDATTAPETIPPSDATAPPDTTSSSPAD